MSSSPLPQPPSVEQAVRVPQSDTNDVVLLRLMIMPKNIHHIKEGESILRYSYPAGDALVENIHGFLHAIHSTLERGIGGKSTDVALLDRGDIRMCAAYETIFEKTNENKEDDIELIICCLWTVGELSGGSAVPKVQLHKDGKEIDVEARPRHIEIGGVKITKISYDHNNKIISSSEITDLSVSASRVEAVAIQSMCNSIPTVSHNISERLVSLAPHYWHTLTLRLVRTMLLLWPSLLEASVMFDSDISTFLDSFVKNVIPSIHCVDTIPNSSLFSQSFRDDAKYVLHELSNPSSITSLSDGSFVMQSEAPRYHPYGQFIMYRHGVVSTTLPRKVLDSLLLYLTSIEKIGQFNEIKSTHASEEHIFTDTVVVRRERGDSVKSLLVVYQREYLTIATILLPGVPECGISEVDILCGMKKASSSLLATHGKSILSKIPPPQSSLPPDVVRFWIACNRGMSEASGGPAAPDSFAFRTFDSFLPHFKTKLRKLSPYTIHIDSPSKKYPVSYTIGGWQCPTHSQHMIVVLWANTTDSQPPSLPVLFCRIAASVLV